MASCRAGSKRSPTDGTWHHPEPLERGLEVADHELETTHEELLGAGLARMLDRAPEVVEDREQAAGRVLALVAARVGDLLGLAPLEVLEVSGKTKVAQIAVVSGLRLRLLTFRRRVTGGAVEVAFVGCHAITMPTLSSKHARRRARPVG